jgi:hypothetical protein
MANALRVGDHLADLLSQGGDPGTQYGSPQG